MKHAVSAALVVTILISTASRADEKSFALSEIGQLKLKLPDGWTAESNGATTVKVDAPVGRHVSIQMTLIPARVKVTDTSLKNMAEASGGQYVDGSKEKKITLESIKGDNVSGYVCSFTDASADPGEFACVTAGALKLSDRLFAVTLLYNDKTSAEHDAAMKVLQTASVTASKADANIDAVPALRVKSPDGKWAVLVPGKWDVLDDQLAPGGQQRQVAAANAEHKWLATVFLETAANAGDAKAAREFYFVRMQRNPIPMTNVKRSEFGDVAVVEYDQDIGDGASHNINAYVSYKNCWVDVHMSKTGFDEAKDWSALAEILKGIKVDSPAKAASGG